MVEGPGHMPLDQIEANMKLQQSICMERPFMFWDRSLRILRRAMITSLLPLEEPLQLQQELPSSAT